MCEINGAERINICYNLTPYATACQVLLCRCYTHRNYINWGDRDETDRD